MEASWNHLGALLLPFWELPGLSRWAFGILLGAFGALLGPSWRTWVREGWSPNYPVRLEPEILALWPFCGGLGALWGDPGTVVELSCPLLGLSWATKSAS